MPVQNPKSRPVNDASSFAEVVLPTGCFSSFFTGILILLNLVSYFFLFPALFPNAAYEYISNPSIRLKGTVDLASSIYISIWIFRFSLIRYFGDLKSFEILARMNFVIALLFCVANFISSADYTQKVILGIYFAFMILLNYVPLSFIKSVRLWGGFVSVLIFTFLRITKIVQF